MTTSPLSRRRFLMISAAAVGVAGAAGAALALPAQAGVQQVRWRGIALGAAAEIRLMTTDTAQADALLAATEREIRRLEAIFSLHDKNSALARLNRDGRLDGPPLELVELLGLSARLHGATDGAFDPSIQPLWALHAESHAATGKAPGAAAIAEAHRLVGFDKVGIDSEAIRFGQTGMALTLNGIAQGFITDRVSALLRAGGMTDLVVDMGEIRANGTNGGTGGWPVRLDPDHSAGAAAERLQLVDRAVASSHARGTTFDKDGLAGHILDPRTGAPTTSSITGASVVAGNAALADGLSTAALVADETTFAEALRAFPGTRARLVAADGTARWLKAEG
ncbi:FAD:protein FMN transferase [Stappia indica]|uniref:FAD:protein FMN transferase n=1 Tax=Stappia indica TaxID=538381 RepID=UPI001CD7E3C1|nr:FAD:protein FMN transferase [Stappia indica]MCA1296763.1 FAD:protein FMN transferase [Stappia indica]